MDRSESSVVDEVLPRVGAWLQDGLNQRRLDGHLDMMTATYCEESGQLQLCLPVAPFRQ